MGALIEEFEKHYWSHQQLVVGIDEAGRGPMAGPCVVGGVVFPSSFDHESINDSKKLSAHRRRELAVIIKDNALFYWLEIVSVETIDRFNIYRSTQQAMETIARHSPADVVLTDAMKLNAVNKEVRDIIKGDGRSLSIAAASILAKCYRDELMDEYDRLFPQYGFARHKGYGTRQHQEAIARFGRCAIHRKSFRFKDEGLISLDI